MKINPLHSARMLLVVSFFLLVVTFFFASANVPVVYAGGAQDMRQCEVGNPPTGTCDWITGILNPGKNTYFEGMATPQKMLFSGLSSSAVTHTISFDMQWTKGGHHAYDWPVSWAQAEALAQSIGHFSVHVYPTKCQGMNPGDTTNCESTTTITATANVPTDPYISAQWGLPATSGLTSDKQSAFSAVYGTPQIQIAANAGIIFSVRTPVHDVANNADTSDSRVTYTIDLTRTGATGPTNLMLMFAAHIAISDAPGDLTAPGTTWGQGFGAKNISGAPYHVQLPVLDGSSSSQDNQLNLNGTPLTPDLVTKISHSSRTLGQPVSDTVTMTVSASTIFSGHLDFYLCGPGLAAYPCLPTNNVSRTLVSTHNVSTTATSVVRSSLNYTPTQNGVYCFLVQWINTDYNSQSWEAFSTTNECVTVTSSTAVRVSSITATLDEMGIRLNWATGSEINHAGFNIYRAENAAGPYARINPQLIPASASAMAGGKYEFVDISALSGKTYYYQLEDVELNGKSTRHAPLSVSAQSSNLLERNLPLASGIGLGIVMFVIGGLFVVWKKRRGQ